jgi:protein-tyrosine phosphatase
MQLLKNLLMLCVVFFSIHQISVKSEVVPDTQFSVTAISPAIGSITPDTRPAADPFVTHAEGSDSSIPFPTSFCWSVSKKDLPITYTFFLSEDTAISASEAIVSGIKDTQFNAWNLKINTQYYWTILVNGLDTTGIAFRSPLFSFKTPDLWPRMIRIDSTTNVRDIGGRVNMDGKMIGQGLFYRSAEFNQTYKTYPTGLDQLRRLGIVCEIDLRNRDENPQIVMPWLNKFIRPVTADGGGMDSYFSGLVNTPTTFRDVFKEMAIKQNYPMILHCRIGADRTGTVVGVLEALLGCSELQMGQDFIWTSLSKNGRRDTTDAAWNDAINYLKSFDKDGSASVQQGSWNYLQSVGVSVNELISIRKIFLNDDHQPFPTLSVINHNSRRQLLSGETHYSISLPGLAISNPEQLNTSKVYDLTGKRVYTAGKNPNNSSELNNNRLTPGIHIIQNK